MPNTGEGPLLHRIVRMCRGAKNYTLQEKAHYIKAYGESVFDIQEDYVNVVIPFNKDVLDNHGTGSGTLNGTLNGTLSDKEQMVVNELLNNASVTYEEMTHKTGISRRTLTRIMTTLQEKGILERVGSKRDGRWVVLK
ncbi:MAG: winged helix-turn-helix transcriptional regulator [Spirochaetales bacterium]|nr:winged helix-turn-helix transcriptional regulator [Candidatus Physcosoma equi]